MSTHGGGKRGGGRRRGGRRRAGGPPPDTPDQEHWDQGQWDQGQRSQEQWDQPQPGYPPPGYQAPGEPGAADPYGYQPPPQPPSGYGHQPPPQDPSGYGHQPPQQYPPEPGYDAPPQHPSGYGHQPPPPQHPPQEAGHGYQEPPGQAPPRGRRARRAASPKQQAPAKPGGEGRRRRAAPAPGEPPPAGGRRAKRAAGQPRKTKRLRSPSGKLDLKSMLPIPLLVTLVVLAVFIGAGELTVPENRSQLTGLEPAKASVTASRVVCPDAGGEQVGVVAPGSGKGEVTVQPISSDTGSPLDSLRQAPGRAVLAPSAETGAVVASAEGGTAQGFEAEQYRSKDGGSDRGMSDVRCVTPTTDWWFSGPSTTGGNQVDLYLSNIDRSAATVDVLAYGDEGAIDPGASRGLTVDPGQQLKVDLTEIVPELSVSAIRVVARTGRVAASMHAQVKDGNTSYGSSWVPPTTPQSGNVVVPAVPSGAGKRKLVLFTPSERDTTVNVRLSTPDGSFAPAGNDKVDVPAQQVVQVDLGDVMKKNASALQINSDIPLVAAVVAAEGGSGEDGDVAYSAGSPSLSQPGVVAMIPGSGVSGTLQLTAPTKDAEVELRALTSEVSGPKRVKIGAGKTVPVKLKGPEGASTYGASITPVEGSGPVYGSRVLTASGNGPLLTVLPLQPGVREVTLPPVVPEVGAGAPR